MLCSKMKQQLSVPFEHDIQVLVYFLYAHYPHVETQQGQNEVDATMNDFGYQNGHQKSFDLKLIVGRNPPPEGVVHPPNVYGIEIFYFYRSQKLLLEWISSPRNDSLCDSLCMLFLQIGEWATPQLIKMIEAVGAGRERQEM